MWVRAACLLALLAAASPAPLVDQRQEGQLNVHADLRNIVILAVLPARAPAAALDLLAALDKAAGGSGRPAAAGGERRAGSAALEAFAEPGGPYRVDIAAKAAPGAADLFAEDAPPAPLVLPVLNHRYVPPAPAAPLETAGRRRGVSTASTPHLSR